MTQNARKMEERTATNGRPPMSHSFDDDQKIPISEELQVVEKKSFDVFEGRERRKTGSGNSEEVTDLIDKISMANLELYKLLELNKAK